MTTADRVVVVVAVLLLAGADLGPRAVFWCDPVLDNRSRYRFELIQGEFWWTDARDEVIGEFPTGRSLRKPVAVRSLPPGEESGTRTQVFYESGPVLPRDRWGHRWCVCLNLIDRGDGKGPIPDLSGEWIRFYSAGPDGKFDWGEGDDIEVNTGDELPRTWWPLAVLAGVVAIPYSSIRVARLPRSPSIAGELIRASGASIGPIVLAYFVVANGFPELDVAPSFVLVPGPVAVFFTASFIIWLAIFLFRLRRG
jgi:hypothetical protein